MDRRQFIFASVLLTSFEAFSQSLAAKSEGSTLEVHVTYTGSGTVDEAHKLYVALWDSPDFVKEGGNSITPIAALRVMSKSGTARFGDIHKTPVFVSLAYDATGKWDGKSDPPSGTSLGLYSKERGVPAPIDLEPGKTTNVSVELNDSFQKP